MTDTRLASAHYVDTRPKLAAWLSGPVLFWGALLLYLALHVALRLWETPVLGKNDVQEALAAAGWAWGYHPRNPPLHTWLLMACYRLFGVGLVAHVVLKYVLLGLSYTLAYLIGRRVMSTQVGAATAAVSLALLTPFAWTVHVALTHTLLLAVMVLATVWAALRVTHEGRWANYAILGGVIGLGFLAKYSYPLFLGPLLVAMACIPALRPAILNLRMAFALAVAAVVFAPHGLWMLGAHFDFVQFLASKQHGDGAQQPYLTDLGEGMANLAFGILSFVGPLLLVAAITLRGARRTPWHELSPWAQALLLVPALSLGLLLLDVVVFRATQFEERYFLCAMLVAPLGLFALLASDAPDKTNVRLGRFAVGAMVVSLIVFAGLTGRALVGNQTCDRCLNEMPAAQLTREIQHASGFHNGTILTDHYNIGGNLSLAFPNQRVLAANYLVERPPARSDGQCLLVWNARNAGDSLPTALVDYLAQMHVPVPADSGPTFFEAPLLRSAGRLDRFAYWLLPTADGNCEPRADARAAAASSS